MLRTSEHQTNQACLVATLSIISPTVQVLPTSVPTYLYPSWLLSHWAVIPHRPSSSKFIQTELILLQKAK